MAEANQNPLPEAYQHLFVPPYKFILDETFIARCRQRGINNFHQLIAAFMNGEVTLGKTRCYDFPVGFDGVEYTCLHLSPLRPYADCIRSLFGRNNPKRYMYATAAYPDRFSEDNVPVLVMAEDGLLSFVVPSAAQMNLALHPNQNEVDLEETRMENKKKRVEDSYRHYGVLCKT